MSGLWQGVGAESQLERARPREDHVPGVQERPHGAVDLRDLGKDEPQELIADSIPSEAQLRGCIPTAWSRDLKSGLTCVRSGSNQA